MRRRKLLSTIGGLSAVGLAGCGGNGGGGGGENEIAVGSGGSLAFEPQSMSVDVGTTVTWTFESPSHNVSCVPDHDDQVSLPAGAEPFASIDHDSPFDTNEEGETFEHTFETSGDYIYVCTPHTGSGMIGTIIVQE